MNDINREHEHDHLSGSLSGSIAEKLSKMELKIALDKVHAFEELKKFEADQKRWREQCSCPKFCYYHTPLP